MPGFNQWCSPTAFYQRWAPVWFKIQTTFVNREDIPVYVGMYINPRTSGAYTTWAAFIESTSNPVAKKVLLSAAGASNSKCTLSFKGNPKDIAYLGSGLSSVPFKNVMNYPYNAGPSGEDNLLAYIWAATPNGGNVTANTGFTVYTKTTVWIRVKFFDQNRWVATGLSGSDIENAGEGAAEGSTSAPL